MGMANVPGDEVSSLQAAIRYHAGNILRRRLDQNTIDDLGLMRSSPRERSIAKREDTSETLSIFRGGAAFETPEEILRMCQLISAALVRVSAAHIAALPPMDRREVRAALRSVADQALEVLLREYAPGQE
jgi:hypothetical protein